MEPPSATFSRRTTLAVFLGLAGACALAHAQSSNLSDASLVSVAVSVALPVAILGGVGSLVVTGVEASADGVVWLVETVGEGVKGSVRFAGRTAGAVSVAVGTVLTVTVVATGALLCAAGKVIAFIPNEIGRGLSYNQRVSR